MEYLCYQQFSVGWESLEQVVVFQVLEVDMDVSHGSVGFLSHLLCMYSILFMARSEQVENMSSVDEQCGHPTTMM